MSIRKRTGSRLRFAGVFTLEVAPVVRCYPLQSASALRSGISGTIGKRALCASIFAGGIGFAHQLISPRLPVSDWR